MDIKNKRIGIWGYGITGKSNLKWALLHGAQVSIMDKKELPQDLRNNYPHLQFYSQTELEDFFAAHDLVIPSAGIDLRPFYASYSSKFLFELDIFSQEFKKPYIAITGSVGKTTITSLLTQLLNLYGIKAVAGGNIGTAALDLLILQDQIELAVLEVSSFQLEHVTRFKPDLAIISNILENHLDRHGTFENYLAAKMNIYTHAAKGLMPEPLQQYIPADLNAKIRSLAKSDYQDIINQLPPLTFDENWRVIIGALDSLNLSLKELPQHANHLKMPEHRIEYVATKNNVQFFNDSKSTAPAATLAAVHRLGTKPIHLLVGGLSKGIDREPFIAQLYGKVAHVYCFGKESGMLRVFCTQHNIHAQAFDTLEQAVHASITASKPGEIILLSPAGSSYDLFENFEHRGRRFKEIIHSLSDK